jgi:AIR synthase-related protein
MILAGTHAGHRTDGAQLAELTVQLRASLRGKLDIQPIARALRGHAGTRKNGDDTAVLRDADGYTLFAAEGMLPSFVASEPYFAGMCAVLTNVNDVAAMGGRARAIVDVLFAGADQRQCDAILAGLVAGAELFDVPLVGGHTGRSEGSPYLCAAVLGKARKLITSCDAAPGDRVVACIDLAGSFRGETRNFDSLTGCDPERARARLELLPELAEAGLVHAGKDISMAGVVGTLLMLLECSGCGATLHLDALPSPQQAALDSHDALRWLQSFPSYGFLLAARPHHVAEVIARMHELGVAAAEVAELQPGAALDLSYGGARARYWDLAREPLMGFGPRSEGELYA